MIMYARTPETVLENIRIKQYYDKETVYPRTRIKKSSKRGGGGESNGYIDENIVLLFRSKNI